MVYRRTCKTGYEFRVPLSEWARETLEQWQRDQAQLGASPWVFFSPVDPARPISVHRARDWFKRLEKRAGLPPRKGRGWHSFRRKLVTDLKTDLSVKDLQALGGWTSPAMVFTYMQTDENEQRAALDARRARIRRIGD